MIAILSRILWYIVPTFLSIISKEYISSFFESWSLSIWYGLPECLKNFFFTCNVRDDAVWSQLPQGNLMALEDCLLHTDDENMCSPRPLGTWIISTSHYLLTELCVLYNFHELSCVSPKAQHHPSVSRRFLRRSAGGTITYILRSLLRLLTKPL